MSFHACLVTIREAASATILDCDLSSARDRMISLFGKPEPTLAERLKASVSKTKAALSETVDTIFLGQRKIDPSILKDLEMALLSADLGVKPTREILDAVREKMDRNALSDAAQLKREIKSHIIRILNAPVPPDVAAIDSVAPFAESVTVRYFDNVDAVPFQFVAARAAFRSSASPIVRMLLVKMSVPFPAVGRM